MKVKETAAGPDRAHSWAGPVLALVLLFVVVALLKNYRDLRQAQRTEARLEESIAETEERIERLRLRRDLLLDDPATLERLARDELSMVKDGDLVLVLQAPGSEAAEEPDGSGVTAVRDGSR
jgi:cell division protein FtsB